MLLLRYGRGHWTAARNIGTLVESMPGGLVTYRLRLAYLLIDEGRYTEEQLASLRNVTATLFRQENSHTPVDVQRTHHVLSSEWLMRCVNRGDYHSETG